MNKVILVDADDTIENLVAAWVADLNNTYHLSVDVEDITDWDITKFFPTLTTKQIYAPLVRKSFWKTVKPKEDAILYLNQLQDEGFEIYIVTATDYRNIEPKIKDLLAKYFPFISSKNIILAHRKQLIKGDFLVDDNIHNLIGGDYQGILYTACHNKNIDEKKYNAIRANDWKECYNIIHKLSKDQ